ncbi:MAG: response regulator [Chlamydiota bacterium]
MAKKILVVEDNKDNSLLTQKILEHYGYEVKITETGKETLDYCQSNPPPSLILMDISLPDIDGLELTKQLKKMGNYSYIPVIAVTAHSTKEMEVKILEAGCVNTLFKPYTPPEFVKMVQQYVGNP